MHDWIKSNPGLSMAFSPLRHSLGNNATVMLFYCGVAPQPTRYGLHADCYQSSVPLRLPIPPPQPKKNQSNYSFIHLDLAFLRVILRKYLVYPCSRHRCAFCIEWPMEYVVNEPHTVLCNKLPGVEINNYFALIVFVVIHADNPSNNSGATRGI